MPKNPYNFTPSTLKGRLPSATGDVIFVDSVSGNASGDGSSLRPFNSIQNAFAKSGLSFGDTIMCLPGHVETVTAAAGTSLSVAGIRVIAAPGRTRPTINFTTATTATLTVTAAGCSLEGFLITQGFDAVVSPIVVSAADFTFRGNEVITGDATYQCTNAILTTAGANRMLVEGNHFHGSSDAGTAAAIKLVGGDSIIIKDNIFFGAYTSSIGAINSITTLQTNLQIIGNNINNVTASSTKAIVLLTGTTGQISRNNMQILSGTAPITGDAISWVGSNYYAATIATAGTLI